MVIGDLLKGSKETSPNLDQNLVTHYVRQAWQHERLTALKLIFNLSLVNRDVFFSAVEWLKENHLNTLSLNLQNFVRFGCLNVLPQLLNNWVLKKKVRMSRYHWPRPWPYSMKKKTVEKNNMEGDFRKDKHIMRGKRAVKIYNSNSDYRYLFVCIADLFAKLLKSDIEYLKLGEIEKISMASKWCPSLVSLEDQRTLLCEGIVRRVFPRDSDPEYKDIDEAHYAYRAQDRLHKEILVPLRKALVSAKRCESVPPKPALSDDMKKLYAEIFDKTIGCYSLGRYCDLPFSKIRENKYKAYLEIATLWEKASGPLLPNEIVVNLNNGVDSEVVECEWQRLVRHMESKGRLKNCLAICDISKNIGAI
ncbi:hypothetical protein SO802_028802 [Lithocarpus litseifolius]|uniref:DUF2828 domain-containing protein n=1 Tax=Lithocarpus litseifolius TaxID=425828 RepID=A0AAW2BT72_9ROSI